MKKKSIKQMAEEARKTLAYKIAYEKLVREFEQRNKMRPPRYDRIYHEGVRWINSL